MTMACLSGKGHGKNYWPYDVWYVDKAKRHSLQDLKIKLGHVILSFLSGCF